MATPLQESPTAPPLGAFLRQEHAHILSAWEEAVRALPGAERLSLRRRLDQVPALLERLAEVVDGDGEALQRLPAEHALERLGEGLALSEVMAEYALLRRSVHHLYRQALPPGATLEAERLEELARFEAALDEAIGLSVNRYGHARSRAQVALDRIAAAALESADVERFLPRLLSVLLETTEAVDSAVVLLREGEELEVRAALGLEVEPGLRLRVGEGVPGHVALTREPLLVHSAATDARVRLESLRTSGTRALYAMPLLWGGEVLGVTYIGSRTAWDFSDAEKQLFRTMANRAAALLVQAQLREEERRTAEFRERLLGIVSHDLRNPLHAITLSAAVLRNDETVSPRAHKAAARISASAERMERMIADLLDFTRGRLGGGLPLTPRTANLRHVVGQVLEELEAGHPERTLLLQAEGDFCGEWDADRLAQLFGNLGKNALDYSPPGTPVTFRLFDQGDWVRAEVHNEGPPISPALLPELFAPFRRGPAAGHAGGGLGLGLYISALITQAHRGVLSADSRAGEGTTFTVRLPRITPTPPSP